MASYKKFVEEYSKKQYSYRTTYAIIPSFSQRYSTFQTEEPTELIRTFKPVISPKPSIKNNTNIPTRYPSTNINYSESNNNNEIIIISTTMSGVSVLVILYIIYKLYFLRNKYKTLLNNNNNNETDFGVGYENVLD